MQDKHKLVVVEKGAGITKKPFVRMPILADTDYRVVVIFDGTKFHIIVNGNQKMLLEPIAQPFGIIGLRVKNSSASSATGRISICRSTLTGIMRSTSIL